MITASDIAVVIPTYGREAVLLDTIRQFLDQDPLPGQVIVVDQTRTHAPDTEHALSVWSREGKIDWIKAQPPSQPAALNRGLHASRTKVVLFVDDDIRIARDFVATHARAYEQGSTAVAGRVVQPEDPDGRKTSRSRWWMIPDIEFAFTGRERCFISNGMSGNLSVRRDKAIKAGGFDEQFMPPVSYRFDTEFCKRLGRHGGTVLYEPAAVIYHLRAGSGGTRTLGSHLTSASPVHGVGDYYFALRQGAGWRSIVHILRRPVREVCTRFHLLHPWWIPVKLTGELRAFFLALALWRSGPRSYR